MMFMMEFVEREPFALWWWFLSLWWQYDDIDDDSDHYDDDKSNVKLDYEMCWFPLKGKLLERWHDKRFSNISSSLTYILGLLNHQPVHSIMAW